MDEGARVGDPSSWKLLLQPSQGKEALISVLLFYDKAMLFHRAYYAIIHCSSSAKSGVPRTRRQHHV